ncbi:hypothetical protein GCM10009857_34280 [Agromyces soli]
MKRSVSSRSARISSSVWPSIVSSARCARSVSIGDSGASGAEGGVIGTGNGTGAKSNGLLSAEVTGSPYGANLGICFDLPGHMGTWAPGHMGARVPGCLVPGAQSRCSPSR